MAQIDIVETKLDNLIESFQEFKKAYGEGKKANVSDHQEILRVLNGNNGTPGLKQEVFANTSFRKVAQKIYWFVGFSFLGMLLSTIWQIVKSSAIK